MPESGRGAIPMGEQTPVNITHPDAEREQVYRRRMKAAELRRLGNTWEDIAVQVGYADRQSAHGAVKLLLKEHQSLAYSEIALYRQESLDRLTTLLKVAMEKALLGDEKMMREARLIISQIDDLTGAKAPIQLEIGESDVDRTLRELSAELDRRAAEAASQAARGEAATGGDH